MVASLLKPATHEAYKLLHDGALAFSRMEEYGIRIDKGYLDDAIETTGRGAKMLERGLSQYKTYQTWRKIYGSKMNLDAGKQLKHILYDVLKHPILVRTRNEEASTDESALEKIDDPFIIDFLKMKKLRNLRRTHLNGIRRELIGDILHAFFNLHSVITYRSSANDPNFQNIPIRNEELAALIRPCFIPRKGNRLVELDYKAAEVRVAACYNKDPNLIRYVTDPNTDMHRDMSVELFLLDEDDVHKDIRDHVKNKFVFPEFYGSFYINCAVDLWDAIHRFDLKTNAGVPLKKHLQRHGITELGECDPDNKHPKRGTFERHVRKVEKNFWNERFPTYRDWKDSWYQKYQRTGGINTLTGFKIEGLFARNEIINYGIQGSAFHCDLWACIQLDKWIRKNNMKTRLIGQIHDSILADCPPDEVDDYIAEAQQITTRDLPRHWDWIIVPMSVEISASPINGSWHEKKRVA